MHVEPGKPFIALVPLERLPLSPIFAARDGRPRPGADPLSSNPARRDPNLPAPASEPRDPGQIETTEELYLTGLHLEQYRHATRYPENYWSEALNRDPDDVRSNNAMGLLLLRRGQFRKAEAHFRQALSRLTQRNSNPYDGEPWYNLGVALEYQGRLADARAAFYKAAWNYTWQSPSYHALAAIDCLEGDLMSGLEHLDQALRTNTDKPEDAGSEDGGAASCLAELRKRPSRRARRWHSTRSIYRRATNWRFAAGSEGEFFGILNGGAQTCLDVAFDYAAAGLWADAESLMERFLAHSGGHPEPDTVLRRRACLRKTAAIRKRPRDGTGRAASRLPTTASRPGSRR